MPREARGVKSPRRVEVTGSDVNLRPPSSRQRPLRPAGAGAGASIFSDALASDRMTPLRPGTRSYAARLDRHRLRARLYRPFVRDRQLRGSDAAVRPPGPFAEFHLSAVAGDLLHVVDVLRVGGTGLADRLRLPDDLCGADPRNRILLAVDHAHRAPR